MAHDVYYFVLDMLANDLESIEDVLRMLEGPIGWRDHHPGPFTRDEVVSSLIRGIRAGTVMACVPDESGSALIDAGEGVIPADLDNAWYRLTRRGRVVHENWDAPHES